MEISGFAIDQNTTYPLPGASVVVMGTGVGTITDARGYYYLNSSAITPASNILITYVGYIPAQIPADFILRQNAIGEDVATSLTPAPPQVLETVTVTTTTKTGSFNWLLYAVGAYIGYKLLTGPKKKGRK